MRRLAAVRAFGETFVRFQVSALRIFACAAIAWDATLCGAPGTLAANAAPPPLTLPAPVLGTRGRDIFGASSSISGVPAFTATATAPVGHNYGVYGHAVHGDGIFGISDDATYPSILGENLTVGGIAMYGKSQGFGVLGGSLGSAGVVGYTTAPGSATASYAGVVGVDKSTSGTGPDFGVVGISPGVGVVGTTHGTVGVLGATLGDFANTAGVYGLSIGGVGVYGLTEGTNDDDWGAEGLDFESTPLRSGGLFGFSQGGAGLYALGGSGYGIYAQGESGPGVFSDSLADDGVDGTNERNGGAGIAGFGGNPKADAYGDSMGVEAVGETSHATALAVDAVAGLPIAVVSGKEATKIMSLDASGNMILAGTLTQSGTPISTAQDARGVDHVLYGIRQTVATIDDVGEAQMTAGRAYVRIDPAFADVLDPRLPYMVFLTPDGPTANPLYVTGKTASGFFVREISNRASLPFDYRIVGYPLAAEARPRMAEYRGLVTSGAERDAIARRLSAHATSLAWYGDPRKRVANLRAHLPSVRGVPVEALAKHLELPELSGISTRPTPGATDVSRSARPSD